MVVRAAEREDLPALLDLYRELHRDDPVVDDATAEAVWAQMQSACARRRHADTDRHAAAVSLSHGELVHRRTEEEPMRSRGFAVIAAVAALAAGVVAGPAVATPHTSKQCTRNEQRSDTTRFETRTCTDARADRVRTDMRIRVRSQLPTAAAADDASVRLRERVRDEERNGDMRVRVRTEHRRRVDGNVLRDEVRVRIEVRNANHPQVTIGTAANGVLPITVTQLDANGQPVVLRTLTVSVPQAT